MKLYFMRTCDIMSGMKKLSSTLQDAVFNDSDYRLLSSDKPVSLNKMLSFDKKDEKNKPMYLDRAYNVIPADNLVDLGLTREKHFKYGNKKRLNRMVR